MQLLRGSWIDHDIIEVELPAEDMGLYIEIPTVFVKVPEDRPRETASK
jgi:hypothetical protein